MPVIINIQRWFAYSQTFASYLRFGKSCITSQMYKGVTQRKLHSYTGD